MRSASASLDYFVHHGLKTLIHDKEVISSAFICCILPSILSYIYNFIELLYSYRVEVEVDHFEVEVEVGVGAEVEVGVGFEEISYLFKVDEGIIRSLIIEGFLILILVIRLNGLHINLYTSRHLPISLTICCFATVIILILTSLSGEITSHFIWGILSFSGHLLLPFLCNSPLTPINMRSYLVIRYIHHCRFIPITLSHRHGIYLSFTGIVMVILTIPEISLPPLYEMMLQLYLYIVFIYVLVEIATENVSFLNITVDIELESLDRSHLPLHLVQRVVNGTTIFHLPLDLVQQVVDGLTTFKNYIAANRVSRDWRSAFSSISRGPQLPLPVLMLSEPLLTDMRTLFSLYDHSRHRLQLSEVRGKRIWGSQHGWVVTLGPRYVTQLVHLIKGKRISLPPLDAIRRLAPREEWFCLVHKFILLKDPSDESTFLVIAIFGPMDSLAFTRVRLGPALKRRGEGEWVVVANPENLKFKDAVHFNGQIYALCDNGKLVRFEPVAPFANMVQVIADHPQDVGAHLKIYLESLGNLYGVFRNGFLIPSERRFETTSFFVYKFNFNASAWEEVKHLEGRTFLVGDGNSFSWRFPIPSRSDCIYFTDDHWVWRKFPRKAYGGHDVGLFDMATRDILPLKFGKDKPRFYSRPIFVTRNGKL